MTMMTLTAPSIWLWMFASIGLLVSTHYSFRWFVYFVNFHIFYIELPPHPLQLELDNLQAQLDVQCQQNQDLKEENTQHKLRQEEIWNKILSSF